MKMQFVVYAQTNLHIAIAIARKLLVFVLQKGPGSDHTIGNRVEWDFTRNWGGGGVTTYI